MLSLRSVSESGLTSSLRSPLEGKDAIYVRLHTIAAVYSAVGWMGNYIEYYVWRVCWGIQGLKKGYIKAIKTKRGVD